MNKIIRIEEISLGLDEGNAVLKKQVAVILGIEESEIINIRIVKRAIDSRHKRKILFNYSVDVVVKNPDLITEFSVRHRTRWQEPYVYEIKQVNKQPLNRPVIVGSGPSGLFCALLLAKAGLRPLVIERGNDVDSRVQNVTNFFKTGKLNTSSNVQFGEGGAGTFSDGKLYTLINDRRSQYLFQEFVAAGAPSEIIWSATPHIGTDKLRQVVKNIRQQIIDLGGEVRFAACLTDLKIDNLQIKKITINSKEEVNITDLVLAIGHSARDTYQMLYDQKLLMTAKPFAMGVRIEHLAENINKAQYGDFYNNPKLGTAKYKLVEHLEGERSVYTFCMCPGGYVMAAASEPGYLVVNGMSEYAQDGANSNSALLVPIAVSDFKSSHPLAGVEFQRYWEKKAYDLGGSNYQAPAQLVGDFLIGRPSTEIKSVKPSYPLGVKLTSLETCLPDYVVSSLKKALPVMAQKISGFSHPEAVLTGVETRSSSPVRIDRNQQLESNIAGLYPIGEGAGHAGGIVSSAIDGMIAAETIIAKYL
ncbi:MAG: NAD(P)/FAD-dependent oxidoreductase [Patescibacteria group bacterium]